MPAQLYLSTSPCKAAPPQPLGGKELNMAREAFVGLFRLLAIKSTSSGNRERRPIIAIPMPPEMNFCQVYRASLADIKATAHALGYNIRSVSQKTLSSSLKQATITLEIAAQESDAAAEAEWNRRSELNRQNTRRYLERHGKTPQSARQSLAKLSPQERIEHVRAQNAARQKALRERRAAEREQSGNDASRKLR